MTLRVNFELHDGRTVGPFPPDIAIRALNGRSEKIRATFVSLGDDNGWSRIYNVADALAYVSAWITDREMTVRKELAQEIRPLAFETPLLDEMKRVERVITETAGISRKQWQSLHGKSPIAPPPTRDPNEAMIRRDGLPFPRCPLPALDRGESLRSYQVGRALAKTFAQIDAHRWEQMK